MRDFRFLWSYFSDLITDRTSAVLIWIFFLYSMLFPLQSLDLWPALKSQLWRAGG